MLILTVWSKSKHSACRAAHRGLPAALPRYSHQTGVRAHSCGNGRTFFPTRLASIYLSIIYLICSIVTALRRLRPAAARGDTVPAVTHAVGRAAIISSRSTVCGNQCYVLYVWGQWLFYKLPTLIQIFELFFSSFLF